MKRNLSLLAILVVCILVFTGCQCSHEWTEADCLTPKTCTKCEAVEGEALGHAWQDATCDAPKTCSGCGLTEGEPLTHLWAEVSCAAPKTCEHCGLTEGEALPHTWVEANYQAPQTCSVCGQTEGSPVTASFEAHGLHMDETEFDVPYTFTAGGKELTVTFTSYQNVDSDDSHEALDGYEWHIVDVVIQGNGTLGSSIPSYTDYNNYYDMEGLNASLNVLDAGQVIVLGYTVNHNGVDYTDCLFQLDDSVVDTASEGWTFTETLGIRIPVGFDGIFICVGDGDLMKGDYQSLYMDMYADENTVFFRLN